MVISWSTSPPPTHNTASTSEPKVVMFSEKKNQFISASSPSHSSFDQNPNPRNSATIRNPFCDFIKKLWVNLCGVDKDYNPIGDRTDVEETRSSPSDTDDEVSYLRRSPHSGLLVSAFLLMRLTLMVLGRWPFLLVLKSIIPARHPTATHKKTYHHSKMLSRIRVLSYEPSLKSPIWLYFGLTTIFICFALVMSTLGFFDFFLEWRLLPNCRWATNQKNKFKNNLVMFLLVWGCLLHSTLSSVALFVNRRKVARTLNFWNVAAEELNIGNVKNHRRFLIMANLGYVLFLVLIYFAYSWWSIRFVRDAAMLFGTLTILPLLNEEQLNNTEELRVFGIFMIIYCVYASRAFLFIFCFKCRLLRTLFHDWNQRLIAYLRRPHDESVEYEKLEKIETHRLLRDMTILLKMVKQMDALFATVLQSYYSIQLLNMCFELYMLAKSGTKEFAQGNASNRSLDIVSAFVTLGQNVYFFFTVSLDGSRVGEEAAEGLEALRRHHITARTSIHQKYLIYNLSLIYQQRIVLTGGKFFVIDRPFIITVLGAVLTYFVIILQVEPSFSLQKHTNVTAG